MKTSAILLNTMRRRFQIRRTTKSSMANSMSTNRSKWTIIKRTMISITMRAQEHNSIKRRM